MKEIIQSIRELAGKAQFVSFLYTSKKHNETARHTLILGANYKTLVEKSKLALELLTNQEIIALGITPELAEQAKQKILASLNKTLAAGEKGEQNEDYTKRGQYVPLGNGLNLNSTDLTLQLFGLTHAKVVITPGVYPVVNSRPLTIAQDKIKDLLPISKFREFALDVGNIHAVKLNGNTLEISDDTGEVNVITRQEKQTENQPEQIKTENPANQPA